MPFLISALVLAGLLASFWFTYRLEENSAPGVFYKSRPGRVVAVAFQQPFVIAMVVLALAAFPIQCLAAGIERGPGGARMAVHDLRAFFADVADYYTQWVPTFVNDGYML